MTPARTAAAPTYKYVPLTSQTEPLLDKPVRLALHDDAARVNLAYRSAWDLKGIGPKRSEKLSLLGVNSIGQFLAMAEAPAGTRTLQAALRAALSL